MPATFATLMALDERLGRAGHHRLTPWWRDRLREFYSHPTARTFVGRVGRGGAKSHTSVWVGLNETLNGSWLVPPGEVHFWVQVSENKGEAAERLRLYCKCLDALHVDYERSGDVIIIPSLRRGIRVLACQIGSVSGFRAFGYAADELAKWESADTAANPAEEVCASIDAMAVQYPDARSLLISSPWGTQDFHAVTFDKGTNEFQVAAHAETWVANPSITRDQCWRKAKGIDRIFQREYGAIPGPDVDCGFFEPGSVMRAFDRKVPWYFRRQGRPHVCIDASSGRGDGFVWGVVTMAEENPYEVHELVAANNEDLCTIKVSQITGRPVRKAGLPPQMQDLVVVQHIDGIFGQFHDRIQPPTIVARIAQDAARFGADRVHGDQHGEYFISQLFRQHRMNFVEHAITGTNKPEALALVRQWLDTDMLVLPSEGKAAAQLKLELLSFTETLTSGGRVRLEAPQGGHDDGVMMLAQAALAAMAPRGPDRLGYASARGMVKEYRRAES